MGMHVRGRVGCACGVACVAQEAQRSCHSLWIRLKEAHDALIVCVCSVFVYMTRCHPESQLWHVVQVRKQVVVHLQP